MRTRWTARRFTTWANYPTFSRSSTVPKSREASGPAQILLPSARSGPNPFGRPKAFGSRSSSPTLLGVSTANHVGFPDRAVARHRPRHMPVRGPDAPGRDGSPGGAGFARVGALVPKPGVLFAALSSRLLSRIHRNPGRTRYTVFGGRGHRPPRTLPGSRSSLRGDVGLANRRQMGATTIAPSGSAQ